MTLLARYLLSDYPAGAKLEELLGTIKDIVGIVKDVVNIAESVVAML